MQLGGGVHRHGDRTRLVGDNTQGHADVLLRWDPGTHLLGQQRVTRADHRLLEVLDVDNVRPALLRLQGFLQVLGADHQHHPGLVGGVGQPPGPPGGDGRFASVGRWSRLRLRSETGDVDAVVQGIVLSR